MLDIHQSGRWARFKKTDPNVRTGAMEVVKLQFREEFRKIISLVNVGLGRFFNVPGVNVGWDSQSLLTELDL